MSEPPHPWRRLAKRARRLLTTNPFAVPGTSKRIQRAMWLFWLDGLFVSTSVSLVGSYLVLYALEFGATSTQIGLMSTIVSLASMAALLPGAHLAEKWLEPRRAVLLFSRGLGQTVWVALGLLPFFLTGQPAVYGVMALRAARSFTMQAASPAWTTLSGRIVPRRLRGKYFAARNIAKQASAFLVVPAAGWLIDRLGFPLGYQLCFGLAAAIGVLAFWAYARIPFEASGGEEPTSQQTREGEVWESAGAKRNYWTFCATSVIWTFSLQLAAPFFSVYLVEVLGATAGIVGTLAAIQNLTALPGQVLFGRWLDRRGVKWTFRFSGLLIPLLPWMWLLATGPWGVLPARIGTGFLYAGYNLANFNMLLLATPRVHRTRHIALYRTIVQSAAAVAPLLGGLVVERFEFAPIFVASGIGRLISVLLLLRFVREPRARPASGTKLKRGQTMEIGYLADHPAFIPTLVRWHHAQWSYLRPGDTIERRTARLKGRLGKNQIPTTFVAYDTTEDGREIVVGSASLLLQDLDTRPDLSPWLASVYVDEEYRRQGIGSALVERAAQEAAALKVKTLYLFTPDRQRFYERLGWYEIERCAFGGSMQVVMARDL